MDRLIASFRLRAPGQVAFAAAVMLAVAGCADRGSQRAPVAAAPAPAPAPAPAVPLPAPEAFNRVAVLVPTTGPSRGVGQSIANAAAMAAADLGDKSFRVFTYNTAGEGGAAAAARQAIDAGAGIILGPLLAADVRAVAPVARAGNVPVLSFSNDAAVAGDGVYVLGFQPADSVQRLVSYARSRGISSFAALTPGGTYGARVGTAFLRAVEAGGGRVTGVVNYSRDQAQLAAAARKVTDYDGRLARAKAGKATVLPDGTVVPASKTPGPVPFQALLIADSGAMANSFVPALAKLGAAPGQVRLMGTELWAAEPNIGRHQGLQGAWFAAVPNARFTRLAERYRERHQATPSRLSSLGYDSVLLVGALAKNWPIDKPFPAAQLRDPGGFSGIDGIFRFPASGIAERGYEVRQVGAGGNAVVSAAPTSFGRPIAILESPAAAPLLALAAAAE